MRFSLLMGYCDPDQLGPIAVEVERSGWDGLAVPDSVFYPEEVTAKYPYSPDGSRFWGPTTPFVDPLVAIAFMASATSTLRFTCAVLKLAIRHPLLVAKQVASVSAVSGGRLTMGAGLSWIPEEFAWLGQDFDSRAPRTAEAIEVVRLVLSGGMVEHHGKHYDFGPLQVSPAPPAPVPIYVGGVSPGAVRRAARHGDGWISVSRPLDELEAAIADLRSMLEREGRDGSSFEIVAIRSGRPDAEEIGRAEAMGVTELMVVPWPWFGPTVTPALEAKLDAIRGYGEEVIGPSRR